MSVATATAVRINLEADCYDTSCTELAERFQTQLGVWKYSCGVSVMQVPGSLERWQEEHRTARKRAWRAERLGYRFDVIDRSRFNDDLHTINTSKLQRQGRPMSAGYLKRHNHGALPHYSCERHRVHTWGVLEGERLRAYLTMYRCGDLALVSMILGHGDHLHHDIMYLLAAGMIEAQAGQGGFFYYNRHDSGEDGLRFYKERLGFRETDVEWLR